MDRFQQEHPDVSLTKQLSDFNAMPQLFAYGSIDVLLAPDFAIQPSHNIRMSKICNCTENLVVRSELVKENDFESILEMKDLTVYAFAF